MRHVGIPSHLCPALPSTPAGAHVTFGTPPLAALLALLALWPCRVAVFPREAKGGPRHSRPSRDGSGCDMYHPRAVWPPARCGFGTRVLKPHRVIVPRSWPAIDCVVYAMRDARLRSSMLGGAAGKVSLAVPGRLVGRTSGFGPLNEGSNPSPGASRVPSSRQTPTLFKLTMLTGHIRMLNRSDNILSGGGLNIEVHWPELWLVEVKQLL